MSFRAPKPWSLTKSETVNSFDSWKQKLTYILSLDNNFYPFLDPNVTLAKKSRTVTNRGLMILKRYQNHLRHTKSNTSVNAQKKTQTQISAYQNNL